MAFSDTVHRLTGFGLAIASDRVIRGTLADGRASAGAADLVIETLASIAPVAPPPPVYRWDGEILTFTAPGVAHYRCRRDRITIAAEHDADPDMVCALLISTALPAVLWLREDSVLHAAALVSPAGSALAVAGPSGVGKSTVVHQAIQSGATLLADDSIRLAQKGDRVCGSGLAGGYHCGPPGDAARIFHRVGARSRHGWRPAPSCRISVARARPAVARAAGCHYRTRMLARQPASTRHPGDDRSHRRNACSARSCCAGLRNVRMASFGADTRCGGARVAGAHRFG